MTLDEYFAKGGRAFRRARELELHLGELATLAAHYGHSREAATLRLIASRAMPMAERFVASLRGES